MLNRRKSSLGYTCQSVWLHINIHISFLIDYRISYDEYTLHMPMALAVLNAFNRSFFYTVVFSFVSFRPTYRFSRTFRLSLATARAEHRRRLRTKEHLFCCKQMQLTVDSNCVCA
uniref:Uncharacterized protein n=1 Tax=Glossina palpalis gambiensis TaxID=67801 RepID=A0A1B0C0U0_9MUSC